MITLFFTFILIVVVTAIMSVGVLFGRKPVQGSCGGMKNLEGIKDCEICGGNVRKCKEQAKQ